jgi:hypothetical protein
MRPKTQIGFHLLFRLNHSLQLAQEKFWGINKTFYRFVYIR